MGIDASSSNSNTARSKQRPPPSAQATAAPMLPPLMPSVVNRHQAPALRTPPPGPYSAVTRPLTHTGVQCITHGAQPPPAPQEQQRCSPVPFLPHTVNGSDRPAGGDGVGVGGGVGGRRCYMRKVCTSADEPHMAHVDASVELDPSGEGTEHHHRQQRCPPRKLTRPLAEWLLVPDDVLRKRLKVVCRECGKSFRICKSDAQCVSPPPDQVTAA